jgi:hypothetical protein
VLLGELLRGDPDGLLRVAAERLVPRLERYRNAPWADRLRIALLARQPGCRATPQEVRAVLAASRLLVPPRWRLTPGEENRLRRRLASRMARTGAATVTCDDWIRAGGAWSWRQKPLWDAIFDAETGIGEGPVLVQARLLPQLARLPGPEHGPEWRNALRHLAKAHGGQAHVSLPLLRAPAGLTAAVPTPPDLQATPIWQPLVSVLIPTAGFSKVISPGAAGAEILVQHCLRTLLERSRYRRLEIVLIDGGELSAPLLEELRLLVESQLGEKSWQHRRDSSRYNYTTRINMAAAAARGELLLQLNDDTELLADDGISLLIEALARPGTGIAGALLLYPDGRVQHAGTAIDNLAPRHAWARSRPEALPWGTLRGPRTFHAVTAAVSLCRRSLWERVNGFGDRFPINYGDVDFCLRAAALGQRTVLVPGSRWLHFESASRQLVAIPPELSVFARVWGDCMGGPHGVDHYCSAWRLLLRNQSADDA